jgi:hypothetical protein
VVRPGAPTWLTVRWLAGSDACDFRLTVAGRDVAIMYPSNTVTYTPFYRRDSLEAGRIDYTAFRVVAPDRPGAIPLRLRAAYTDCEDERRRRAAVLALGVVRGHR